MGRIFKTPDFTSWAKNENVDDSALLAAIQEVENGLIDAKLGGNVIKKRVARTGQGKSGGFRTIIAFNVDDKSFFIFGFSKNEKANISIKEKVARNYLSVIDTSINENIILRQDFDISEEGKG